MDILLNDSIISREDLTIDLEDRGYQFGDGIYEVVRIYERQLFEWEAHAKRLEYSAKELMISLPVRIEELYQNLLKLIKKSSVSVGYVYIQVTRGTAPRAHGFPENCKPNLIAYAREMARPLMKMKNGVRAVTADDIRWLRVDIKSLNLLGNVLAKQKAIEAKAEEAILIRNGIVTEGSSSNVFAIREGKCFTHPANHYILNGITRQLVLRLLNEIGVAVEEIPITKEELFEMDEIFITSTIHEICPVIEIDGVKIGNGAPGVLTGKLQSLFDKLIFPASSIHYSS
ncbi:D-amino-acid transaminase [Parageobacillus thermoglucosidasius]|uniref:D-alanine aminotransferase n=1 Tax=Parageobacillus thermoglucosidasius TaxID=1426 RepID=A0AAN0YPS8_PARTM|nr:D-amino-acid transaminase [Parageobacillus thermoglucosidasius]ALF11097.1 D-alanine aminotransferase [Parageobacillus thermoglucosidasius]ANZ31175.1 D-amino-acid transaminase [Parageobacillus thermoglucosidasius]APM81912.1 D-amino-acid transaminase [Parageobacillus thermoglucosidasius]KJX68860.1 D-alanine aminotransferase [Parageobacillus thermoglucosidasius]RDE25652.1 D-amino-acid transaminase [Parageobacillus thermoglucosidasius]